jgi:ABC-type amino acid transport substrate-binding protein
MRFLRTVFLFFISLLVLQGCSCGCGSGSGRGGAFRVGIDPNWYPIDFGPQQSFVNGFVEDLLLEIARYTGIEFERMTSNWDSLLDGMMKQKFDAVLTSLPPYDYNKALYDFSSNFIDLGPVLIVPVNAQHTDLAKMGGELVGLVTGDPAVLILNKHPEIVIRNYPTIPDLLNSIMNGETEAGLLNGIPATSYIKDLYSGVLKVASKPMNDSGLHLLVLKDTNRHFLRQFDKALEHLKKKKKLQALLKKWQLGE